MNDYRVVLPCPHCKHVHEGSSHFGDASARARAQRLVDECGDPVSQLRARERARRWNDMRKGVTA